MKPMTRSKATLIIFILVVVAAAWFTNPDMDSFKNYFSNNTKITSAPIIQQTDYKLYSVYQVTYYDTKQVPDSSGQVNTIVVPGKTEKYLALFTRFIQL